MTKLRAMLASPLSEELCSEIEQREPRLELRRDHSLLPPMRWPADHLGDPAFRRTARQEREFRQLLDAAEALYGIPGEDPTALHRVALANPRLRWVQTMAAGGGSTISAAALPPSALQQIVFTTSAGVHTAPLAEYALFALLAGAKDLPRLRHDQARRHWPQRWFMGQLRRQRVVVLGLGSIGREVSRLLSFLGATVIGISRRASICVSGVAELAPPSELPAVLATAHALVVCLPGTDATTNMVNRQVLNAARPGLTLVNIGRGTVIDEHALLEALDNGTVGFAALDVTAVEPLPAASALWGHKRVLISPHNATADTDEDRAIAELFADNATALLDRRPMRNVVDLIEFY